MYFVAYVFCDTIQPEPELFEKVFTKVAATADTEICSTQHNIVNSVQDTFFIHRK